MKIEKIKEGTIFVLSLTGSIAVAALLKNNLPVQTKLINKLVQTAGMFIVANAINHYVEKATRVELDEILEKLST